MRIRTSLRAAILTLTVVAMPVVNLAAAGPVEAASNGTITSIAGTGQSGYAGNGGSATAAALSFPTGVAEASNGAILIADEGNNVIRQIAPDGTITTVAGLPGPGGFGGDGGPATGAHLNQPTGVSPTLGRWLLDCRSGEQPHPQSIQHRNHHDRGRVRRSLR